MSSCKDTVTCGTYLHNCLYFTANALARNIGKMADKAFKETGLAPSHAFMIMLVNEQPGITQGELCGHLHLAPSTLTRFADKLEKKGVLTREKEGKTVKVYPTEQGKELGKPIAAAWKRLYHDYSAILGKDEGDELTRTIGQASARIEEEF